MGTRQRTGVVVLCCLVRSDCSAGRVVRGRRQRRKHIGCVRTVEINSMLNKSDRRWLRIMNIGKRIGCHQRADRSFFVKGYQFPVCARCTGVILSSALAMIVFFIYPLSAWASLVLSFLMFLDWFIQRIGVKESNNIRRLITGLLGGYGCMTLQMYGYRFLFFSFYHLFKTG